jgi:phosphohistidine phosphatase
MRVVLFRHGPAGRRDSERWPDDAARPLTPKGEERTRLAALGMAKLLGGEITAILTSPLVRASCTAAIAADALECPRIEVLDALMPGGSYRRTIEAIAQFGPDDVVVLVGHEPDLGKLAGTLLFGAPASLALKKAGACAVHFDAEVAPGQGEIEWFAPPRVLRRLARKKAKV